MATTKRTTTRAPRVAPAVAAGPGARLAAGLVHAVYLVVLHAFLPVYTLFSLVQSLFKPAYFLPFLARCGVPLRRYRTAPGGIWIHAVSVGEVAASVAVVRELSARRPGLPLTLTVTTVTGFAMARRALGESFPVAFAPLDLPWVVGIFYRRLAPKIVAVAELELWPCLFHGARRRGVPLVLFNGRMPAGEARRYAWVRPYMRRVFDAAALVGTQGETDAARYRAIGAPPERTAALGNIKFDFAPPKGAGTLARECGFAARGKLLVVGSSHRDEEPLLMGAVAAAAAGTRGLRVLWAPRHPHRAGEVETLARRHGFEPARRTAKPGAAVTFIVLDTIGELVDAYRAATVVVLGGSWSRRVQGHNPLEASALARPVVCGPCMANFAQVREALVAGGGMAEATDGPALAAALAGLLSRPAAARETGRRGLAVMRAGRGAAARYAEAMLGLVDGPQAPRRRRK